MLNTIADNAANAGIVLGGRPMRPNAVDWRWAGALLFKNGVIEESGLGAAVLNHPANGVAWLANKLSAHGESLAAGEIVLGGSFTRPWAATTSPPALGSWPLDLTPRSCARRPASTGC